MSAQATQGQAKPTPTCDKCEKPFSTKQALNRHVKSIHDGIISLKNLFSTPKALSNQKRLFTSVPNLSTQGNSKGQVNDPMVESEGIFMCGTCDNRFQNQEDMTNHISDVHDKAKAANDSATEDIEETDNSVGVNDEVNMSEMFDPEDDQDLNEAFEELSKIVASQEDVVDNVLMQQRIERFKILVNKKTLIQTETNEEVANLKQVEVHQNSEIKKKEKEISILKKAATKEKEKYRKDMEILRKTNSDSIKENANLNAKLKEKESIIKSLEEALEPDTSDAEEEVVIMNKNTSGHKCTACNNNYSTNTDLESHMDEMHGEAECFFCSKIFQNKKQLKAHVNNCIENGAARVKCKKV